MNFKIASYQNRTATVYNYDHSITTIDRMASVALEGGGALSLLQAGGGGRGGAAHAVHAHGANQYCPV